jgi:hypothetical protein
LASGIFAPPCGINWFWRVDYTTSGGLYQIKEFSKMKKEMDLPEAVLRELEKTIARYEAESPPKGTAKGAFFRGLNAGYIGGLKLAINAVNYEIGIRQNPPNINYPGPVPGAAGMEKTHGTTGK